MSKKNFKLLAATLKSVRPDLGQHFSKLQWDTDTRAVAQVCSDVNPLFDFNRFYEACGGLFEA